MSAPLPVRRAQAPSLSDTWPTLHPGCLQQQEIGVWISVPWRILLFDIGRSRIPLDLVSFGREATVITVISAGESYQPYRLRLEIRNRMAHSWKASFSNQLGGTGCRSRLREGGSGGQGPGRSTLTAVLRTLNEGLGRIQSTAEIAAPVCDRRNCGGVAWAEASWTTTRSEQTERPCPLARGLRAFCSIPGTYVLPAPRLDRGPLSVITIGDQPGPSRRIWLARTTSMLVGATPFRRVSKSSG